MYQRLKDYQVLCNLCNHRCRIQESKRGICAVRENRGGRLISLVYGKLISRAVDPIEKKPLFHFLPGSTSYSVATVGCNFHCHHCQNAEIAQLPRDHNLIVGDDVAPAEIVADALRRRCGSISYTYTEPTIFFEYAHDTAQLAQEAGLQNVFVSNGYMTEEAVERMAPWLHAINIDLKGSESFYREICGAHLAPVMENIRRIHAKGIWVEVTTLVIPSLNDDPKTLEHLADSLAAISCDIPWHISAFHPSYRMRDKPRPPAETIRRTREIGLAAGLRHVFVGNLPGEQGESTYCHACGTCLIERTGYHIVRNRVAYGNCPDCETPVAGVWHPAA